MGLTRRNAVIGLGALVGGTGALAASGAFTTVEAQRQVDIQGAGDADALLRITPATDAQIADDEDDTLQLDADDLNLRARSTFGPELVITNQGNNEVDIDILDDFDGDGGESMVDNGGVIDFQINTDYDGGGDLTNNGSTDNVDNGESVVFDILIDFTDDAVGDVDSGLVPLDEEGDVETLLDQVFSEDGDGNDYIVIEADES